MWIKLDFGSIIEPGKKQKKVAAERKHTSQEEPIKVLEIPGRFFLDLKLNNNGKTL